MQLAALPNPPPASAVTHVLLGRDLKSWLVGRGQGVSVVDLNPTSWAYFVPQKTPAPLLYPGANIASG